VRRCLSRALAGLAGPDTGRDGSLARGGPGLRRGVGQMVATGARRQPAPAAGDAT
jgi:hypothetical protein